MDELLRDEQSAGEAKAWDVIVTRISLSLRDEPLAAGVASGERTRIGRPPGGDRISRLRA
jgi:hypothetical protein